MKSRLAIAVTIIAFAVAIYVDIVIATSHIPGYSAAIGFVGCVVIVIVSKWLGTAFIQRPEHHWPRDIPADEQEDLRG